MQGSWDSLGFLNLKLRESWSGYALEMSGTGPALLALPIKAAEGRLNLSLETGTVRFYFAPSWSTGGPGGGPGDDARLIEFGAWSALDQHTVCWLGVDGLGSTIRLVVEDAKGPVEILRARIQWTAGEWHQVALAWSSGGPTLLYLDGLAVASGVGLGLGALEQFAGTPGFCLGSDGQGKRLAQGEFDELYTFLRACTAEELAWNWRVQGKRAALGPITEEEQKSRLEAADQLKLEAQDAPAQAAMLNPPTSELWLSVAPGAGNNVELTLHNTTPGATYQILSRQDLSTGDWVEETTKLATCCRTQILVEKGGRTALFFRAMQMEVALVPQPNRIQTENAITGTQEWRLTPGQEATPGWPTDASSTTPEIEGYATATSVNVGQTIHFCVDVRNNDPQFMIEFYRMGWYGGLGARKMGESPLLASQKQAVPTMGTDGLIDCAWLTNFSLTIPCDWVSGVYLAKLITKPTPQSRGKESYVILVVREDCRSSDFLCQCSVTTYQAYNPWGGNSLYPYPYVRGCDNQLVCPQCQPPRQPAQRVSFNRPYAAPCDPIGRFAYATGAGEFLATINTEKFPGWEYNLLRWMERQGYDVTYCTSIDTHLPWPATKQIKTFLSVGHDEYWSEPMREHVTAARDGGVNLAFFSANTCFWKIHLQPEERVFSVDKATDLWRGLPLNNSRAYPAEIELLGVEYVFNSLYNADMTITNILPSGSGKNGKHWAFDDTGFTGGDVLPGLLGYEVDGCWLGTEFCGDFRSACPGPGTISLGDSEFFCRDNTVTGHSYMTIYTASSGAQVFATGSMQWNWGLDDFGSHVPDFPSRVHPGAQQLTHNVLRTFVGKNRAPVIFINADAITAGDWRLCDPEVRMYGADGYRIADGAGSFNTIPEEQLSISGEANQAWPDKASDPRALLKACPATDRVAAAWTTTESQNSSFTIDLAFTDTAKHQVTLYCADWLGTGTSLQQIDVYDFTDMSHPLDTRIFLLPPNGIYLVWHLNSPGEPSRRKIVRVSKPDAQAGTKAMVSAVFFDPIQ